MTKPKLNKFKGLLLGAGFVAIAAFVFTGCPSQQSMLDRGDAAQKVYVAPGEHDEY